MACDVVNSIADLWFRLGFLSSTEMAVAGRWVTLAELYQFADDAARLLARKSSIFLEWDDTVAVVAGTPACTLPAGHIFTESAWLVYASGAVQALRLTSSAQLFALDGNWPATTGAPTRLSFDAQDLNTAVLYPNPAANSTLNQIIEELPPAIVSGSSGVPVSPVLIDYFTYAALAGARGKESDSAMPDVAAHAKERMSLYEAVIVHLYGYGR